MALKRQERRSAQSVVDGIKEITAPVVKNNVPNAKHGTKVITVPNVKNSVLNVKYGTKTITALGVTNTVLNAAPGIKVIFVLDALFPEGIIKQKMRSMRRTIVCGFAPIARH